MKAKTATSLIGSSKIMKTMMRKFIHPNSGEVLYLIFTGKMPVDDEVEVCSFGNKGIQVFNTSYKMVDALPEVEINLVEFLSHANVA